MTTFINKRRFFSEPACEYHTLQELNKQPSVLITSTYVHLICFCKMDFHFGTAYTPIPLPTISHRIQRYHSNNDSARIP